MTTDLAPRPPARPASFALSRPAWLTGTLLVVVGCLALGLPSACCAQRADLRPVGVDHLGPRGRAPRPLDRRRAVVEAAAGAVHGAVLAVRRRRARPVAGRSRAPAACSRWRWHSGSRAGSPAGAGASAPALVAALALVTSTGFIRDGVARQLRGPAAGLRAVGGRQPPRRAARAGVRARSRCAALLRPESWPFLAAYGLWLAWRDPRMRKLVVGAGVLVLALWFLPELWGSGELLRAAERANNPDPQSPAFAANPALAVLQALRRHVHLAAVRAVRHGRGRALARKGRTRRGGGMATALPRGWRWWR